MIGIMQLIIFSFLFLGCDGVFEILNSYKVMEYISSRVAEK